MCQLLLDNNADPNIPNIYKTPLILAIRTQNIEIADLLLEYGANFSVEEILLAFDMNEQKILELFFDRGLDVNFRNGLLLERAIKRK